MNIDEYWAKKKLEIVKSLDATIERAKVDVDTLKTMKELIDKARMKVRIEGGDYK